MIEKVGEKKQNAYLQEAQELLAEYLRQHHLRQTPERKAMAEAVFAFPDHFTIEELSAALEERHFRVSIATLYNNMDILAEAHIICKHYFGSSVQYERCLGVDPHIHRICLACGKVQDYANDKLMRRVEETAMRGFYKDLNHLYIYGICGKCMSARRRKEKMNKQ